MATRKPASSGPGCFGLSSIKSSLSLLGVAFDDYTGGAPELALLTAIAEALGRVSGVNVTLYVGNLPWSMTEEDLRRVFAAHVTVRSVRVIRDRETDRSRGFGFVEVAPAEAQKAIITMNGAVIGGRPLIVNEAQPKGGK
jgi:hypothetical protein